MGFLTEEDLSLKFCPLTGLPIKGRVTLETVHGGYILYKFKPIGVAYFEHASLKRLGSLHSDGSFQPLTAWAGLCRVAYELDQTSPIVQGEPGDGQNAIPETFEDKRHHFLRLFYEAGGKEHKSRGIFLNDDFPMAFAQNAEEFSRIFHALVDDGFLRYDKASIRADFVDGRRAHFRSVLLTSLGKQRAKKLLTTPINDKVLLQEDKDQIIDFEAQTCHLLNYIYREDGYRIPDLLPVRDHAVGRTSNANEFEMVVDYAESRGWLSWGTKAVISLGRIHYRDVKLTLSGIKQVKSSTVMFQDIINCPLTGLPLKERGKFEPFNGSKDVLYTFKPIGCAVFKRDDLIGVLKAKANSSYIPNTDLAGICREAQERGQPTVYLTPKMLYNLEGEFSKSFEEKQAHLLRLLYETGGREHKKRNLFIEDDFPLAFAESSQEFTEVLESLLDEELLRYDKPNDTPNDWTGGIRTHYPGVLLTPPGKRHAKELLSNNNTAQEAILTKVVPVTAPIPAQPQPATPMNKRYQIFISSTFADLQHERLKVQQAVMDLDCIPAGMEAFPAIDEEQFEFIKRVIDDCDYYLLVIGGRYGSVSNTGTSYTEMEYDYAINKGIKSIILLHKEPGLLPLNKSEQSQASQKKLAAFRDKVAKNRLVKFWNNADELPGLVASSLSKTISTYPAIGWVRANAISNPIATPREHTEAITPTISTEQPHSALATLHFSVQQSASSRFDTAHYSDAILAACTALDKAIQARIQRPDLNGKQLMDVAFTPRNPVLRLSQQDNEQTGFMLLYQGVILALRNHYAHNDTATDPARALEWLGLISALFYKLDEAQFTPLTK